MPPINLSLQRTVCFIPVLLMASIFVGSPSVLAGFIACPACIPTCLAAPPACWPCIIALCATSCFDERTQVTRIHGEDLLTSEQVVVADIHVGDTLLTLDPVTKEASSTVVTANERIVQPKIFIFLVLDSGKSLSVTSDHGIIVKRGNHDLLVPASNVLIGDGMYVLGGDVEYVVDTTVTEMKVRYALQTANATVLAADMFVGTLCGSELSHDLNAKLAEWNHHHRNGRIILSTEN